MPDIVSHTREPQGLGKVWEAADFMTASHGPLLGRFSSFNGFTHGDFLALRNLLERR